ncbi:DUF885 domain-containing protein [Steroidobacter flavus]|uniref:DUF885 domain-containing protein n=1 Tax=Steroidobacter flavus TaxID=1842136 RepID=A0ABV8SVH2_9GAMM
MIEGTSLNLAQQIADDAWGELQRRAYVQAQMGAPLTRLPDLSLVEAERRSELGRSLLKRLEGIEWQTLPHDWALTLRLVQFNARVWVREAEWYWLVVEPTGLTGFFCLFLPTAYCGGFLLNLLHTQLRSFTLEKSGDADHYLELVAEYASMMHQMADRTAGQAARGIRMPKVQIFQARALLQALKSSACIALDVSEERLSGGATRKFLVELRRRIAAHVAPAFDRALAELGEGYFELAPESVGIGQYLGGADVYAELVKIHTTLELTPEEVHARGHARLTEIEDAMRVIRGDLKFKGDATAFLGHLNQASRWRAHTIEGVTRFFQRYMDRAKPHLSQHFRTLPKAPYAVAPLPEALQKSYTFGFSDPPRRNRAEGLYLFNAENLTKQALFTVAALTYHELMPGHHLHCATQQENESLHPLRKYGFVNAYNEGWAEYAAANLSAELGLYEEPEERYGRLMFDAFLTSRLVVDTGMNVLGWSLERGQSYLRDHSGLSEAEILTESLRYSCDRPAQALAYKLGDTEIVSLREQMKDALGARFSLKDFHEAVLGPGALPLHDLKWHINHEIVRLRAQYTSEARRS